MKVEVPEDVSPGGIALPVDREGDPKDNPTTGVIVDIGASKEPGRLTPDVKIGDRVVFNDFHTTPTGTKDVLVVDFEDIVGVIEE